MRSMICMLAPGSICYAVARNHPRRVMPYSRGVADIGRGATIDRGPVISQGQDAAGVRAGIPCYEGVSAVGWDEGNEDKGR